MFCKHPGSTARIAIAALWLLRRAVIQEVATRVKEQLEELGDLEGQVAERGKTLKISSKKLKRSQRQ